MYSKRSYRDFLKCLSLLTAGVLLPDDFTAVLQVPVVKPVKPVKLVKLVSRC